MEPTYCRVESTIKPLCFEVGKSTVYLRKNIIEEKRENASGESHIVYVYEEAALPFDEFNEYSRMVMAQNALKATNDSDNIVKIISGQEASDFNQLTLMGAIADLYEMLLAYTEANQNG